jgi:hypothetical protein
MLTIDCKDVLSIKNELLVYVSDQVAAIPTLKNKQFILSTLDDDEILETSTVISAIKEFLNSIGENHNFAVISNNDTISITSIRNYRKIMILANRIKKFFNGRNDSASFKNFIIIQSR